MLSQAALEQAVLALLCHTEHAPLVALKVKSQNLFTNRPTQRIVQEALGYIEKYQAPPKQALEFLLENDLKRAEGIVIRQQLEDLEKQASLIDPVFILENLDNFLETQALTRNLTDSIELLQQGDLAQAKELIYKASSIPSTVGTPGLWMKDPKQALRFLDREEHVDYFSSGVDILDNRGVRPERKTLMFMIAPSGKGKSWWLVEIGKKALQFHHKVLHITLEISEEKTAKRYIQSIFSLTKDVAQQIQTPYFDPDPSGATILKFRDLERDSVINQHEELIKKLERWKSCPPWIIKEFPTSTLSVEHLSLYIDSLKRDKGFVPDILIIDYADLMKIDAQALRVDTGRLYRELRGLAVSKNIPVVTATQGNRESEDAKTVRSTNVSEDWSKVGTADNILTYSQTVDEKRINLARIFVAKSRDSADRFMLVIGQAYPFGQFCLGSGYMSIDMENQINAIQL